MKNILSILEKILLKFGMYIGIDMQSLGRKRRVDISYKVWDYPRFSSLELISSEIYEKGLQGNVAELGVYKGEFASIINEAFHDRKLYLFDTFEGFNKEDIEIENKQNYSNGNQDFSDTNVELVLSKMKYRDNCVIKKGYFNETVQGVEDKFVFVSLDPDLYKPTYDGLNYFYPRLVKGGYIFVHDYNNMYYKGAKDAVRQFCSEKGIGYFPLSDNWGSAVIIK